MKTFIYFILMSFLIIIACNKEESIYNQDPYTDSALKAMASIEGYIMIEPSGDISGVTDANNIEQALEEAKLVGGTVYLSDGNYYTSRNIIVEGFNGTLMGESKLNTIIHAGRRTAIQGFEGSLSPYWQPLGWNNKFANVLQLDNATGNVVIKDLTILLEDDQPTDLMTNEFGVPGTTLSTFIEILGGEHNTLLENVKLEGKATNAAGNWLGMNAMYGLHVMPGPPGQLRNYDLTITNVEVSNVARGAVLFMKYDQNSNIEATNISTTNVGIGIDAGNITTSDLTISDIDVSVHPQGYHGMFLWNMPGGPIVRNNTVQNQIFHGIGLYDVDGALIADNLFANPNDCCFWTYSLALRFDCDDNVITNNRFENLTSNGGAIGVWNSSDGNSISQNDFRDSNLKGWTMTNPGGPGALLILGNSIDNEIHEMKFPPSEGSGNIQCVMISDLSDNPSTPEYDGANSIHNWQSCENLAQRLLNQEEVLAQSILNKGRSRILKAQ